ncbi:MAG: ABC transporter substrate-binding protein [Saprospiraceae bacterium]|nr:MAG: ABC transporter substrate-binding protein [Saprospiraceae bacterium]
MLTKLAWRNIWRNRRRTFITAGSVMFAVFFAVFLRSIQEGTWNNMLDNVVNFYYGYAQVHREGYQDDQSIDKAFEITDTLKELAAIPSIKSIVPRLESFALASHDEHTTGVMVVGTQPDEEDGMTQLSDRLVQGNYLDADDKSALVGLGLANYLKLGLGDTIVLISQGYHGVNAAGKYAIKGLLKFGSPELNKRMVYLALPEAQRLYGAEQLVTTLALNIENKEATSKVVSAVNKMLGKGHYEVLDWQEMMPDLVQAKELDTGGSYLVLFVLYIIIGFGIFGTILMMTEERSYEFGILLAIGMKRLPLSIIVWLEIVFIGLIGTLAGMVLSFPLVYYFHINPIDLAAMGEDVAKTYEKFGMEPVMPAALDPSLFLTQAIIVLLITTFLAIYPFYKINKLDPISAMRR